MPTLYLIDGYAQFFRAYHAIRTPMSSPVTKEPTNMTFGFVGMLLKLLRGDSPNMVSAGGKPDYLAVAIDVSGDTETFRSTLYPDYKAHRPPPPEDLFPQIDRSIAMLRDLGIPVVGVEAFEADDTIATIVDRLSRSHPDLHIRIVSKDKDLKQLICSALPGGGCVELYDIHTDQRIDADALKADTGLTPAQVIDMLALMGDTVDNVPGVDGVGPKTAAQLVVQYGSLDGVLAHAAEIKGKRGENIRAAAAQLDLARQLVTLRKDAPIEFDLDAAAVSKIHLERLIPILKELGFNRYQEDVKILMGGKPADEVAPAPSVTTSARSPARASAPISGGLFDTLPTAPADRPKLHSGTYRTICTKAEMAALVKELEAAPAIAVDTETTGLSPLRVDLCGISLSTQPGTGVYIPVRSLEPSSHLDLKTVVESLRPILEDPAKPKIGHNLKYDLLILRNHGLELRGLTAPPPLSGGDTMVFSFLIDASRSSHGLDSLALALLQRTNIHLADLIGSGKTQKTFDQVPLDLATDYAAEDADVALQLAEKMRPQIRAMGLTDLAVDVETPLVEVLAELEWNGIEVDPIELDKQRARLATRIDELKSQIQREAMENPGRGFDPDSPKQLAGILFNKPTDVAPGLGLKSGRKTKTGDSTDAEVLDKLASDPTVTSPLPSLILEYRQLTKLVNTYLVTLKDEINPKTKRIHASFNQTGAVTGRLSSSDPNLQNIPIRSEIGREIRRAFIAPPARTLITADYSQIELRLLAHLSRDPAMTEAFRQGEDIHTAVAAQIHGVPLDKVTREQRSGAKMVNFGIVYGVTPFGLARRLKIETAAAAEIITSYKKRFAGIATFLEECIAQARRYGYVETMLHRRRAITEIDSTNSSRKALAERLAINSVVQGSAADLIKIAMVDLHGRLSENAPHWRGGKPPEVAGVKMLLQIHDELVFEAPVEVAERARDLIVERMEKAMELTVPLKADAYIAHNWYEGK
jgi:DNA polymerase-1